MKLTGLPWFLSSCSLHFVIFLLIFIRNIFICIHVYFFSYKLIIGGEKNLFNSEYWTILRLTLINYFWFLLFRLQELTVCSEDNVDVHDIELLQYINVDCAKLKRLLKGTFKCMIYLKLIAVCEKPVFWMYSLCWATTLKCIL